VHRDVHATRLHCDDEGVPKFNPIGLPYNFKKLLKKFNYTGHLNYTAPELVYEQEVFTEKIDIWALGCSLYSLLTKREPFEGRSPQEVKQNIMYQRLEKFPSNIPACFKGLITMCL